MIGATGQQGRRVVRPLQDCGQFKVRALTRNPGEHRELAEDPSEAPKVQAPPMIHLAGLDDRVSRSAWPWIAALRAADKRVTYFKDEGVHHAFNNDTSAERYDKAAADLAWRRTLRLFRRHLG